MQDDSITWLDLVDSNVLDDDEIANLPECYSHSRVKGGVNVYYDNRTGITATVFGDWTMDEVANLLREHAHEL